MASRISVLFSLSFLRIRVRIPCAGYVSYVINTRAILSGIHYEDGLAIRRTAIENNVTMFTSLDTVRVLLDVLEEITIGVSTITE